MSIIGLFCGGLVINMCLYCIPGCLSVFVNISLCLQAFIYRPNSLGFKTRAMLLKVSHSQFPVAKLIFIPSFNMTILVMDLAAKFYLFFVLAEMGDYACLFAVL